MDPIKTLYETVLDSVAEFGIETTMFRNAMAKKLALSLTESLCLTALGLGQVSKPTEISRFTGLSSGATTIMLDRLEARQFIRRKPDPNDRRSVIVEIDSGFSEVAFDMVQSIQNDNRNHVSNFSQDELEVINRFLTGMSAILRENSNTIEKRVK